MTTLDALQAQCKVLHLSTMAQVLPQALTLAEQQAWSGESLLLYLLEQEVSERQQRRIVRLLHEAQLPTGKTLATFDQARLPLRVRDEHGLRDRLGDGARRVLLRRGLRRRAGRLRALGRPEAPDARRSC